MSTITRTQPFKGLYVVYELLATVLVRIPTWIIGASRRSWRPRPSWTIQRTLLVNLIRHHAYVSWRAGIRSEKFDHHALDTSPAAKGVWVPPCPDLVVGEVKKWATLAHVDAVRVPGYWLHRPGGEIPIEAVPILGEKVFYSLHGGAFVRFSAHHKDLSSVVRQGILQHEGDEVRRMFAVEYRLSKGQRGDQTWADPFPAALLDALAGYVYLINTVGFAPQDIIVVGDSAGANLALALARYLVENRSQSTARLPDLPGGLVLLSPWVDLGPKENSARSSSYHAYVASDFLNVTTDPDIATARANYFGSFGAEAGKTNRYISPASLSLEHISFAGFPRTLIVYGGAEVLVDEIRILYHRMVSDMGEDQVHIMEFKDGVHNFIALPFGHEPERGDALRLIAKWIRATGNPSP